MNFYKAGAWLWILNAAGHGGDGQFIRRLARRRQKRHIDAVHRHGRGLQEAEEGRRNVPQAHGVLDIMPVLADRRQIAEHDGNGDGQLFRHMQPRHGGEKFADFCRCDHKARQHAAGIDLMHKAEKGHEHRPPGAGQHAHAPDGERTDERIGEDAAQRVSPFPAQGGKQADERHERKLKLQVRRKHGAQDAEQDEA